MVAHRHIGTSLGTASWKVGIACGALSRLSCPSRATPAPAAACNRGAARVILAPRRVFLDSLVLETLAIARVREKIYEEGLGGKVAVFAPSLHGFGMTHDEQSCA